MQPFVSFIVPVYQAEKHLHECVESLLCQTNANIEVILVDDGSTDHSPEICDRFAAQDSRVSVVHKSNAGVSMARNTGIQMAKGTWVCFVDADDCVNANFSQWIASENDEKVDAILFLPMGQDKGSKAKETPAIINRQQMLEVKKNILNRYFKGIVDLRKHRMTVVWGKAYRRTTIVKHEIFFPQGIISGEDMYFNLSFFSAVERIRVRYEKVYYYRISDSSVCHRYNPVLIENYAKVIDMIDRSHVAGGEELQESRMLYIISTFLFITMQDFCHPDNPKPYLKRKKEFLQLKRTSVYRIAFQSASLGTFPIVKKLACMLLRQNCFLLFCGLSRMQSILGKLIKW